MVESRLRSERSGLDTNLCRVVSLNKDTFTPRKVLVIPRKQWRRPDMSEIWLTGTLSVSTNKQTNYQSRDHLILLSVNNIVGCCYKSLDKYASSIQYR